LKTIVIKEKENTRIPFLRGILTRSLLEAGLVFERAFDVATQVREELMDTEEVTTAEIHSRVCELLKTQSETEVLEQYQFPHSGLAKIQVYSLSGRVSSFSRGRHEAYLQASGMKGEKSEQITAMIYD
jgi:2-phosphoglycerate kinase